MVGKWGSRMAGRSVRPLADAPATKKGDWLTGSSSAGVMAPGWVADYAVLAPGMEPG